MKLNYTKIKNYLKIGSFFVLATAAFGCGDKDKKKGEGKEENMEQKDVVDGYDLTVTEAKTGITSLTDNDTYDGGTDADIDGSGKYKLTKTNTTKQIICFKITKKFHKEWEKDGKHKDSDGKLVEHKANTKVDGSDSTAPITAADNVTVDSANSKFEMSGGTAPFGGPKYGILKSKNLMAYGYYVANGNSLRTNGKLTIIVKDQDGKEGKKTVDIVDA